MASEFPKRGVEITNVDHVAGGVADFDAVADAIRPPNEYINPTDKTFHRRLHGQTDDDRADAERGEGCIPVHKNHRDGNQRDQ